jgi:hypothetical protein
LYLYPLAAQNKEVKIYPINIGCKTHTGVSKDESPNSKVVTKDDFITLKKLKSIAVPLSSQSELSN